MWAAFLTKIYTTALADRDVRILLRASLLFCKGRGAQREVEMHGQIFPVLLDLNQYAVVD